MRFVIFMSFVIFVILVIFVFVVPFGIVVFVVTRAVVLVVARHGPQTVAQSVATGMRPKDHI